MVNTNRHAIMMIIHNLYDQAAMLVSLLDDERFDFYIHVDAKSTFSAEDQKRIEASAIKSRVVFVERISVFWGDESQIWCELNLFKAAAGGKYSYYHLISGVDFPLRSPTELYELCQNSGREYVQYMGPRSQQNFQKRVRYYWIFQDRIQNTKVAIHSKNIPVMALYAVQQSFILLQRCVGYDRRKNNPGITFAGGSSWLSISHEFMSYVLEKEVWIRKTFHHTCCADELFVQTVMINSPFYLKRNAPERAGSCEGNLRYVDWKRGRPYIFQNGDFEEITAKEYLFVRKIDSSKAPGLFRKLTEWYRKQG